MHPKILVFLASHLSAAKIHSQQIIMNLTDYYNDAMIFLVPNI